MTDEEAPQFEEASEEEWDAAKPTGSQTGSKWDRLLDSVAAGTIIRRDYRTDPKKIPGDRISIGRRGRQRNVPVAFRSTTTVLYIRRQAEQQAATSPTDEAGSQQQPSSRARKRKAPEEEQQAPQPDEFADHISMDESGEQG